MTKATQQTKNTRLEAKIELAISSIESGKPFLYTFIDMSQNSWKVTFSNKSKERTVSLAGGDYDAFGQACELAKKKFNMATNTRIIVAYEAGQDGFHPYRRFTEMGMLSVVVDPASISISQRARNAKTDRLDAEKGVKHLIRYMNGEKKAWSIVKVPTVEEEDNRRLHRERERLLKERISHENRITMLLKLHGINKKKYCNLNGAIEHPSIPENMREELKRELVRLDLANKQIAEIAARRKDLLKKKNPVNEIVCSLIGLKGIGLISAWQLSYEFFGWRKFSNRRELAAAVGLAGTPFASGQGHREQGISKAGNWRIRCTMVQLAWGWLRHQPDSALSRWFNQRWGSGAKRGRRVGIVAVARRLLIDLWRYIEQGLIPEGVVLKEEVR